MIIIWLFFLGLGLVFGFVGIQGFRNRKLLEDTNAPNASAWTWAGPFLVVMAAILVIISIFGMINFSSLPQTSGSSSNDTKTCPVCGRATSASTISYYGMCSQCYKNYEYATKNY